MKINYTNIKIITFGIMLIMNFDRAYATINNQETGKYNKNAQTSSSTRIPEADRIILYKSGIMAASYPKEYPDWSRYCSQVYQYYITSGDGELIADASYVRYSCNQQNLLEQVYKDNWVFNYFGD